MKKASLILGFLFISFLSLSQNAKIMSKIKTLPADTLSYKILSNDSNIVINDEIKSKINNYRKKEDYIWEAEPGLKILI